MTTVDEALSNSKPPLAAELAAGIGVLSGNQTIIFNLYKKLILPLDGFVFWVNYDLIIPTAGDPPSSINIQGSLHYSTEMEQEESSTISYNTIVFTALTQCDIFNQIDPQFIYLANYNGIQFAFGSQGKYYQQADLWHYIGIAVSANQGAQVINSIDVLNSLKQVVSNSLPIWLAMPTYVPPYPGFTCPILKMYPSFLVPENEIPPFASVHIEDTQSLAEAAMLGSRLTSTQLSSETVRVTLYGVNNDDAITFLNFVIQYSYDWQFIGMMNMPIINDEKDHQSELQTIAQKKIITFKVSYLQNSVRDIARQHILHAKVKYYPSDSGIVSGPYAGTPFVGRSAGA
jgi:hypothetical protein